MMYKQTSQFTISWEALWTETPIYKLETEKTDPVRLGVLSNKWPAALQSVDGATEAQSSGGTD